MFGIFNDYPNTKNTLIKIIITADITEDIEKNLISGIKFFTRTNVF